MVYNSVTKSQPVWLNLPQSPILQLPVTTKRVVKIPDQSEEGTDGYGCVSYQLYVKYLTTVL